MRNLLILTFSLLFAMSAIAAPAAPAPAAVSPLASPRAATLPYFTHYVFFGDSLTDMGNYQEKNFVRCLEVSAPVTNKTGGSYPGNTWANMTQYGFSATPSKDGGNDYAVSGANTYETYDQITKYLTSHNNNISSVASSTLYAIWSGADDVLDFGANFSGPEIIKTGMMNTIRMVNSLADAGARNILIVGMPNFGLTPLAANPVPDEFTLVGTKHSDQAKLTEFSAGWNTELLTTLDRLRFIYPDVAFYFFNPYPYMNAIVSNPAAYGFAATIKGHPNNWTPWCEVFFTNPVSPDNYIFYNVIHPTTHMHELIARDIRFSSIRLSAPGATAAQKKQAKEYIDKLMKQYKPLLNKPIRLHGSY